MALPIYQSVHNAPPKHDPKHPEGNCGLWFERFYDRYNDDFSETKDVDTAFSEWLKNFDHLSGDSELLDSAIQRQSQLVSTLGGRSALYKTDWHFVTGMGNPHPLENGFNWHPVLGVPYLSGSSIKGLVRAWVESWAFEGDELEGSELEEADYDKLADTDPRKTKFKQLLDWFGSTGKKAGAKTDTGKVIFFDAIPFKPVRLTSDIITPHMDKWYADGGEIESVDEEPEAVPADWHSPKPIYFLAAKEPVFLFSFAVRNELFSDEIDLDVVAKCLEDALEWLGAGAKTSVGYGQFYRDDKATDSLHREIDEAAEALTVAAEQSAQLEGLSGVALELKQHSQQADWESNKTAFTKPGDIESWLDKLEETRHEQAVEYLCELVDKHFVGLLANPEKTSGKKKKAVFNQRQKEIAGRLLALKSSKE